MRSTGSLPLTLRRVHWGRPSAPSAFDSRQTSSKKAVPLASPPPKTSMLRSFESYTAEWPQRADGTPSAPGSAATLLQAGGPPIPLALVSAHTSPATVNGCSDGQPPKTISVLLAASYTAL